MTADWGGAYNGLTFGAGTPYRIAELVGLHDTPDVRSSDEDRARAHGQFAGVDLLSGRSVQASLNIVAEHPSSATWQAFSTAMVAGLPDELPLDVQIPGVASGRTVRVYARVRRLSLPITGEYRDGVGRARVEWWATDPRIYDANLSSVAVAQASSSGAGAPFPLTFPLGFGGATAGGIASAPNDGEFPAPWVARIAGPIVNPRLENITTGQALTFVGTLNAGETLVVDSKERSVLLGGTASRYSWLTAGAQWFDLAAGANQIRLAGTSGTGSMTLEYRSAWI